MDRINNDYFGRHKRFRVNSKKLAVFFLVLAFTVAITVFWWLKLIGITVTGEAFCGLDEHTHGAECYVSELICTLQEEPQSIQAQQELTTEQEEPLLTEAETEETVHTHTKECYTETLSCNKTEHVHTVACFPDKTADVETVSDWLNSFKNVEITNNIPENLTAIALSQIGYEESDVNFELDADANKNGYTRYGEWYGNPYGKWNTMFVSFCLHYSNINNASELRASGAEAMRLAWQKKDAYISAEEYTPDRGDVVFIDNNGDKISDEAGIVLSADSSSLIIISGDSNNRVETKNIKNSESVIGYGLTGELSFAADKESVKTTEKPQLSVGAPSMLMQSVNSDAVVVAEEEPDDIKYITDLTEAVRDVIFRTEENEIITAGSSIYIGQTYIVSLRFSEDNTGEEWVQFSHNDEHYLYYQIPHNIHCEPFTDWHPISAKTENGTVEDVGKYFIDENGFLLVKFIDVEPNLCFGQKYSNVEFTIDFNATVGSTQSGSTTDIVFNEKVDIYFEIDGSADMNVTKTHGSFDPDNHTMEYTIKVEATKGLVKDLVIDDQIWENHFTLRDTIVVTDLDGNLIDPQPVVSDHPSHNSGANEGFRISGFPEFSAGNGYLITYKTQIYDDLIYNDTVDMWNGLDVNAKNSKGENIYKWVDDWIRVELEKMQKEGKQTYITDADGNTVPVIEWEVEIKKDNHNLQGTVVIDTLGEGLAYYTGESIKVKHYNQAGTELPVTYIEWKDVTVNGNEMSFPLPDGYSFVITYYTTYEELAEGDKKNYTNRVKATINGKEETAGGTADVVGFIPHVRKSAHGDDGENVYFTIEADIPGVIKNWGHFYLTDLAAFWNFYGQNKPLYVDNNPENLIITAVTEDNQTITFTPYVEGGPIENTYILKSPADGDLYHSFNIYFNTSTATTESSKWLLDKASKLTITYKIPFDSATGTEWQGEADGSLTVEDALLQNKKLANEVYFNYSNNVQGDASVSYEYAPIITKKASVKDDGIIDYTVVFNSTVPGSSSKEGYLYSASDICFNDIFDEKLEYVPGSLTVTCYSPWNEDTWFNVYRYNGTVSGNSMSISASAFDIDKTNDTLSADNISWLKYMENYQVYCNSISGGRHIFTYSLRVKDDYLYTTQENVYEFDNAAELTWNPDGTSGPVTENTEFKTGLLDKHAVQEDNKLHFDIHVNRNALDILEGTDTVTIEDTMTSNLSVYWDTIKLSYEDKETREWIDFDSEQSDYSYTVAYDQTSNKLTFTLPDELHILIDYSTLITQSGYVSVNNAVKVEGKAQVSDIFDAVFRVEQHSGGATGSMHDIILIKQDGATDERLPDVSFHLYGPMGDHQAALPEGTPQSITTDNGKTLDYIGTYTTGDDGTVKITTQYLTLGGPYALVEVSPPEGYNKLENPVYFYYYEPDPDGIIQTVSTIISVENYTYGFVLPETGGAGTLTFTIIGLALTAAPVLYSIIRRKRERRLT